MDQGREARELVEFLEHWPASQQGLKRAYLELLSWARALPGATWSFLARPGVSHSLRFDLDPRPGGRARPVFFLVDAVDDGGERFLSVCFYEDEVSDPEELGNAIPQGLFQETGYCFDLEEREAGFLEYLRQRLIQAHRAARGD